MKLELLEAIMICNEHFFSYPPHLSISWKEVAAIITDKNEPGILFLLKNGSEITLPDLSMKELEQVFIYHAKHLEQTAIREIVRDLPPPTQLISGGMIQRTQNSEAMHFMVGNRNSLQSAQEHNPEDSNAPLIPKEVLIKLIKINKIITGNDNMNLGKAEPHCNCFHCQMARVLDQDLQTETEEVITENDLSFQDWEIQQTETNQFTVTNKLNKQEAYKVSLGEPVTCTCGVKGCEHVLLVLKS